MQVQVGPEPLHSSQHRSPGAEQCRLGNHSPEATET